MENQLVLSYASDASDNVSELKIEDTELELRSWNLFSVLLSIGRPVSPIELASRCTYYEVSDKFVEFVCSVPNSPILLTSEGLVTVSSAVCKVLKRFLFDLNGGVKVLLSSGTVTRDCVRNRACEEYELACSRKRRRLWPNGYEKADQAELSVPFMMSDGHAKVYIQVDDAIRSVIMSTESVGISNDDRLPSLIKLDALDAKNLNYGLNGEHKDEKEITTVLSMKELGSKSSFRLSTSIPRGLKDYFHFQSLSRLTASSPLRIAYINGENSLFSKPSTAPSKADDNNKVISLVKTWIDNGCSKAINNSLEIQRSVEGREYECTLDSEGRKGNTESLSHNTVSGGMMPKLNCGNRNTLCCDDKIPCSGKGDKASCQEVGEQNKVPPTGEEKTVCGREEQLDCSLLGERDHESLLMSKDMTGKGDCTIKNSVRCKHINTDAELDLMNTTRDLFISPDQKHLPESTAKLEAIPKVTNSTVQTVSTKTNNGNDVGSLTEQKYGKKDRRSIYTKQKLKPTREQALHTSGRETIKENKEKAPAVSVKGHSEPKVVPMFESYIVEEEEGSGGYGTVYKTRRKKDGTMFAVKYPHLNANRQHVYNELKMLERFGGKNFVIKYEGSFKSGNSDCLVLEHVAHDRPEVLKREIDVFQLRWYGYCLFRALASLHKQGVSHRDVKPGNFLFSRKASKGYLIDFNLATDLHQKLGSTGKSKSHNDASSKLVPPPHPEFLPPTRSSKFISSKALAAETHSKMLLLPKNMKRKKDHKDLNMNGVMKSQGADGSGITSAKDATSSKVPSGERFREPIPCKGRQEYLNLVQEALQSPAHAPTVTTTPVSKRKRVAAPPAKLDNKFVYLTPMPLQSAGGVLLKNKCDGKQRKEGPCVGTKGFRAPEVLLKSTYQGPKVDMWSAGVTLLYFIIGRTPFVGDPDQNIKEIAKLRGSEDLWEVAKLHDRESSFPPELLQIQSLASTKLQEWCKQNTRRPEFLEVIPNSLIDLVDRCLTVNPRSRISAEEALRHEFFVPCFNELEKQRLIRQKLAHSNSQPVNCQSSSIKTIC